MARNRNGRSAALPDRISLWITERRRPLAGAAIILAAALFAAWASLVNAPFPDQRGALVAALGGGVYLVALLIALGGAMLLFALPKPNRVQTRRAAGSAALAMALWGIAGAFSPDAQLGGVSLARHSIGGDVGMALASERGAILTILLIVGGAFLIAPRQSSATARWIQAGLARAAREAAERAPGIGAAIGRACWAGLCWLASVLAQALRDCADSIRIALQERREAAERARLAAEAAVPTPQWTMQPALATAPAAPAPPPLAAPAAPPPTSLEAPPEPEAPPQPAAAPEPAPVPAKRTLKRRATDGWRLPPIELLEPDGAAVSSASADESAQIIVDTLASFGVDARVAEINRGPSVTQFGIEPGWEIKTRQVAVRGPDGKPLLDDDGQPVTKAEEIGRTRVRVNRITRLANDLALALSAPSIRVEAPVPGRPVIGIEVPNAETSVVALRGLLESSEYRKALERGGLPIALGRDVRGRAVVADLAKMPHVLIAGATGSGKSVCINTIITSLLMYQSPLQLRLILVDPKRVELTGYAQVPHLQLSHVVTEADEVVRVLGIVVGEMDRRYRLLEQSGARNIASYNSQAGADNPLPYWVVVLDELADMMMAAPIEVEQQLVRLAQLARATGIHLVVATQRPSVDVVTGLIKANFPTRIAFATTSQTDARVIMDQTGAEKLLGRGDMLYMSSDSIKPRRVQGAFVDDEEIDRVIEAWAAPNQPSAERSTIDEMIEDIVLDDNAEPETRAALEANRENDALRNTLRTAMATEESEAESEPEAEPEIADLKEPPAEFAQDPPAEAPHAPHPHESPIAAAATANGAHPAESPAISAATTNGAHPAESPTISAATANGARPAESPTTSTPTANGARAGGESASRTTPNGAATSSPANSASVGDTRFEEAAALASEHRRVSASLLQRRMRIGLPRAERLIDQLEQAGIVAPSEGGPSREVLQRAETPALN